MLTLNSQLRVQVLVCYWLSDFGHIKAQLKINRMPRAYRPLAHKILHDTIERALAAL